MPRSNSSSSSRPNSNALLTGKDFAPLYLLYGDESFLIDEAVQTIIDAVFHDGGREFNLDVLHGGEVDAKDIIDRSTSFPMTGGRRVVIVREFDKLSRKDLLLSYIEHLSAATSLILISQKPDFRLKVFKAIKEHGIVMEYRPLYDNEIPGWISARVTRLGKRITPEACQLMQGYVETSLHEIQNEIDKLCVYVGDKKSIDIEDIESVVGRSKQYNLFELQRSLARRDKAGALAIAEHLLDSGESPVGLVAMLARYFQRLWLFQDLLSRRNSEPEIAAALNVRPYSLREYHQAAGHFNSHHIERCFSCLLEADEKLKSSITNARVVITILLIQIFQFPPENA